MSLHINLAIRHFKIVQIVQGKKRQKNGYKISKCYDWVVKKFTLYKVQYNKKICKWYLISLHKYLHNFENSDSY